MNLFEGPEFEQYYEVDAERLHDTIESRKMVYFDASKTRVLGVTKLHPRS